MKKLFLSFLFVCASVITFGQTFNTPVQFNKRTTVRGELRIVDTMALWIRGQDTCVSGINVAGYFMFDCTAGVDSFWFDPPISSGGGSGTITGTGAANQSAYFTTATNITSDSNYTWIPGTKDFSVGYDDPADFTKHVLKINNTGDYSFLGTGGGGFGIGFNNPFFIAGIDISSAGDLITLQTSGSQSIILDDATFIKINGVTQFTGNTNLGLAGTAQGRLIFAGATAGNVTFETQATTGSHTLKWPSAKATAGHVLYDSTGTGDLAWMAVATGFGTMAYADSNTYHGNANITTLGTVASGTWNGSIVTGTYGGTGVNNSTRTITYAGNITFTGAFNPTFAIPASVTYTYPSLATTLGGLAISQTWTGTNTFNSRIVVGSQINAVSTLAQVYRTTSGGADVTPRFWLGSLTTATAGNINIVSDATNQLSWVAGNGTNAISRVSMKAFQLNNTPGIESGGWSVETMLAGSLGTRMVVDSSGRVGIGTTAPSTLLHVGLAGTTLGTIGLAGNTSGLVTMRPAAAAGTWTLTLPVDDGAAGQFLQTDGAGVTSWQTASGDTSGWSFNGTDIFNDNAGNVGIGTSTPVTKLDVNGNINIGSAAINGTITSYNGDATVGNGVASIVGQGDFANLTTDQVLATFTPSSGMYRIGCFVNINTIVGATLQLQVDYEDENNVAQNTIIQTSNTLTPVLNITTPGNKYFSDFRIRSAGGTAIVVSAIVTVSGVSIDYNAGATIERIY